MPRNTVAQTQQLGREVTPGAVVPATKRLGSLAFALSPSVESEAFRPKGMKYPTLVQANKEWSEGDLEGAATYEELIYPLASIFGAPATSQVMDGATATGVYEHVFSPNTRGGDTPVTFTVEDGAVGAEAERVGHVLVTDFGLELSRSEVSLSGSAFGQRMATAVAMTPNATDVSTDLSPILPGQVCAYVSDTQAGLGLAANRLGTLLSVSPSVGGRFSPTWYLNCVLDSFGTFSEQPEPDFSLELLVEANAAGLAWVDRYRDGATRFVRIEANGPTVYSNGATVLKKSLVWDFATKVMEPGEKSDKDGIYALGPTLQVVHDPAWGRATRVSVRNKLAAL